MKFFRIGGSPTAPQSATATGPAQRPVSQYYAPTSRQAFTSGTQSTEISNGALLRSSNFSQDNDGDADYPPLTAPLVPTGASIAPFKARHHPPIYFYNKGAAFYEFTNFSPHPVYYKGKRYPTSEHLFQSFKFTDDHPEIAERVRNCGERPMLAFEEAHRHQAWVRPDWRQVNVEKMEIALRLKFTQHPDLKAMLLGTGDSELVEDSPRDYFWGNGADKSGRNELGKALERLREELRHEDDPDHLPSVRRDAHRFSVQDLTALVPNTSVRQPSANRFSVAVTTGSPVSPRTTSNKNPSLCKFCQSRPKYQNHQYCGRTCAAEAAKVCSFCRINPRHGKHPFCSKTCAAKASGGG
ncbi:hypothetical protein PISMIDRAFT_673224 [Pisolithus microcarpus 441]|uniref:NADAR domain-containing protein n=1 Tax=Pisolithus microcarpus 441 TaxID=765257 RepID=A0A0D0AAF5_9AGAM|nr:DUF1768-domain-containing protein [Pisolithus microcarpus]KIK28943.1 hypothetical protein PISMIDRAFT_673224 [Pisolithus microcarpus 441]